jgi:hypothetical protein
MTGVHSHADQPLATPAESGRPQSVYTTNGLTVSLTRHTATVGMANLTPGWKKLSSPLP